MNKYKRKGMIAAAILAVSFTMQATAFASPTEELNDILENQFEPKDTSLWDDTIGFSQLWDAMEENGLYLELEGGLSEGTAEMLALEDTIPEGSAVQVNLQIDPKAKKWQFRFGMEGGTSSLVDLSLYGDQDQLALTLPQLFEGGIGIRSGSFLEQYEGSSLQAMLQGEDPADLPDFELKFYPEDDREDSEVPELFDLKEMIEEKAEQIQEGIKAEKTEEEGAAVYSVTYTTEDIMDIYRIVLEKYLALFENSGLMFSSDADSAREDVEKMITQLSSVVGDEIEMDFTVRNDLVEKISWEMYCDTHELTRELQENEPGTEEETEESQSLVRVNTSVETAEDFQGYLDYELTFADPEHPWRAFDFCMTVEDPERNEMGTFYLEKETTETDTTSELRIRMELCKDGESFYSDTPVEVTFDAETGDLDAVLKMADEESTISLLLSSTFSDVEKGKSFLWTIKELSLEADGEKAGLQGSLQMEAIPHTFEAPEHERMVLELSDSELMSLLSEMIVKGEAWMAQFEPETEAETDSAEETLQS